VLFLWSLYEDVFTARRDYVRCDACSMVLCWCAYSGSAVVDRSVLMPGRGPMTVWEYMERNGVSFWSGGKAKTLDDSKQYRLRPTHEPPFSETAYLVKLQRFIWFPRERKVDV